MKYFKKFKTNPLQQTYELLLYVIGFGLIVHAPLTVWLSSNWPNLDIYFKSWKEALLVVAFLLALAIFYKTKAALPERRLVVLIAIYGLVHLAAILLTFHGWLATIAGLMIDLRYLAYFLLVLFAARMFSDFAPRFIKVMFAGGVVVGVFAILQVTVLPDDFLKNIGYGKDTIMPYLTVDQSEDFVRINSTLRGPNPLGAYAAVFITIFGVWLYRNYRKFNLKQSLGYGFVMVGALVALWFSYSRSAVLGLLISLLIVSAFLFKNKINNKSIALLAGVFAVFALGAFMLRDTYFVSSVLLHENIYDSNQINSNEGHASSLQTGTEIVLSKPLGAGVGSTGSASLYTDEPFIIENQYLFVAHEVGWIGLGLFLAICFYVFRILLQRRRSWLAMSVLASGVGLAIIGILLPVWADDTVSMLWWAMAGLVIGSKHNE